MSAAEADDLTPAERFAALSPEDQEAVLTGRAAFDSDGELVGEDYGHDDGGGEEEGDDGERVRSDDGPEVDGELVPHFTLDEDDEPEQDPRDVFQFTLGLPGEPTKGAKVLTAARPKSWVLMNLAVVDPNTRDIGTTAHVINTFLDHVLDAESRAYVRKRFMDPDDEWDVTMLVPVINACKARWYGGRPTGRATGSSGSPGSRGTRSKGRSPSKGRKRKR